MAEEPRLERVQELRQGGKLDEAQAAMPAAEVGEAWRGRAVSLQARLDLAKGKADLAEKGLREGMEVHRREGRVSDEGHDAMALSHVLLKNGRNIAGARQVLQDSAAAFEH